MATKPDKVFTKKAGTEQYEAVQSDTDILIGGDNPALWVPEVYSEKWKGHAGYCWLKVKHTDALKVKKTDKVKEEKKANGKTKLSLKIGNKTHVIEEGSVKWSVVYDSAMDLPTECEEWTLEWPENQLEWYYQPELTQGEIDGGSHRPDHVIGSYAGYAPQRDCWFDTGGNEIVNYETGKFCHLYRPEWVDADGNRIWGSQEIVGTKLRCFLPPSEWLNMARFPVTLDPTLGYTNIGASLHNLGTNVVYTFGPFNVTSGILTQISLYSPQTGQPTTLGLYQSSSGTPNNLIADTGEGTPATAAWMTLDVDSPTSFSSGEIRLADNHSTFSMQHSYDSLTGPSLKYIGSTYSSGTLPTTLSGTFTTIADRIYSIYATYTEISTGINPNIINCSFISTNLRKPLISGEIRG